MGGEGLFARVADWVTQTFAKPLAAFFEYLTEPQTFARLVDRVLDGSSTLDAAFWGYRLPEVFLLLGGLFLLLGAALSLMAYLSGERASSALMRLALPAVLMPLFAYKGPGCKTESYPCTARYTVEKTKYGSDLLSGYQDVELRYDGGRLVLEQKADPKSAFSTAAFYVFSLRPEGTMPLGTRLLLGLTDTAVAVGKNAFYAELGRYEKSIGEFRKAYLKLMRVAFVSTVTAATLDRAGDMLLNVLLSRGGAKAPSKALTERAKDFFRRYMPAFVVASTAGGLTGASQAMAVTFLNLAQSVAALPLLLTLSFAGILFVAVFMAKLSVYAMPLFIGLAAVFPGSLSRPVQYLLALFVFPVVLGAFFALATRVMLTSGLAKDLAAMEQRAGQLLDHPFMDNPVASYVAAEAANAVVKQAANLVYCAKRVPGETSPVGCHPSYAYAPFLQEGYQVPSDPAGIKSAALEIAKASSIDVEVALASGFGRFLLPKGVDASGNLVGGTRFKGGAVYGDVPWANFALLAPGSPHPDYYNYTHTTLPPMEVGAVTRKALALAYSKTTDPAKLQKEFASLLEDLRTLLLEAQRVADLGSSVASGKHLEDLLRFGVRWEVAFFFSPDLVWEGMGRLEEGRVVRELSGLKDEVGRVPDLIPQDSFMAPYSPLKGFLVDKKVLPETGSLEVPQGLGGTAAPAVSLFSSAQSFGYGKKARSFGVKGCSGDATTCRSGYTLTPYLPYLYLDHYHVLNQLGADALRAVQNLSARQFLGFVYVVLMTLTALYFFQASLSVVSTLLEGVRVAQRGTTTEIAGALRTVAYMVAPVPQFAPPTRPLADRRETPADPLVQKIQEVGRRFEASQKIAYQAFGHLSSHLLSGQGLEEFGAKLGLSKDEVQRRISEAYRQLLAEDPRFQVLVALSSEDLRPIFTETGVAVPTPGLEFGGIIEGLKEGVRTVLRKLGLERAYGEREGVPVFLLSPKDFALLASRLDRELAEEGFEGMVREVRSKTGELVGLEIGTGEIFMGYIGIAPLALLGEADRRGRRDEAFAQAVASVNAAYQEALNKAASERNPLFLAQRVREAIEGVLARSFGDRAILQKDWAGFLVQRGGGERVRVQLIPDLFSTPKVVADLLGKERLPLGGHALAAPSGSAAIRQALLWRAAQQIRADLEEGRLDPLETRLGGAGEQEAADLQDRRERLLRILYRWDEVEGELSLRQGIPFFLKALKTLPRMSEEWRGAARGAVWSLAWERGLDAEHIAVFAEHAAFLDREGGGGEEGKRAAHFLLHTAHEVQKEILLHVRDQFRPLMEELRIGRRHLSDGEVATLLALERLSLLEQALKDFLLQEEDEEAPEAPVPSNRFSATFEARGTQAYLREVLEADALGNERERQELVDYIEGLLALKGVRGEVRA